MEYETTTRDQDDLLYIDLVALSYKLLHFLRRLWPLVLGLTVLGGGLLFARCKLTYVPLYRSEAMFSVSVNYSGTTDLTSYSYYYDMEAAELVTETFPYLLQSEVMLELIRQELGTPVINGSIVSQSVAETNLFTLTVTSPDSQAAYDILRAVMTVYPRVSRQVIGDTQLVITREPLVPAEPCNTMSWKRDTALGAALGLMLGMAILVLLAFTRRTALTVEDVKRTVNLSCLAQVPEVEQKERKSGGGNSLLVTRQSADSPFTESLRLLRLKLRRLTGEEDKVLLFTSSVPGEGKSSLALNTALTLAKDNKRVLLVDADLRGPSVKTLLGLTAPSAGLGEYLSDSVEALSFLRHEKTGLYLCAGDTPTADPTPLFNRDRLAAFLQKVRPRFDYIILDTPPCSFIADAAALAAHADKVVYVVREDFTSTAQIFDGVQALSDSGAKLCGFVFNRATGALSGSGYGYGHSYGYGKKYGYGRKYGYGYRYGYGYSRKDEYGYRYGYRKSDET